MITPSRSTYIHSNNYMQNYRTISTIKIVAAVALLATSFVAYDFFFTGHASAVDTAANSATSTLPAIVATIDGINLDVSLFDSEAFTSLQDFTVVLTPQAIGRTIRLHQFRLCSACISKYSCYFYS